MTLWKRICLRNAVNRDLSAKGSKIRRVKNQDNFKLKPIGIGSDDEGLLGKRKRGHQSSASNKDRVRKKRKAGADNGVYDTNTDADRISELPDAIIHHIFSFMHCTKDVVRTSILSRKWRNTFNSYLKFDFDERWFRVSGGKGKHNRIKDRELQKKKFIRHVEKSLALRLDQVPCIDKFRLCVNNTNDVLGACMERWICAAVDKNVKELDILVISKDIQYILPDVVLRSTSITSLKLSGTMMYGFTSMKLSNLRELSIKDAILVNDYVIKKFEENCPLLEDLRLVWCRTLIHLAISGLRKLRRVEVHECPKLSCIEIAASNLESFWYHAEKHQECKIDLKGSGNLKSLTLKDSKMKDTAFQEFISKCPLLEKLVLNECTSLERLTILSGKLVGLALIQCAKLQEVNIDAPNLYTFQFSGHRMPFSSMNVLGLREAKFSFVPCMKTSRCIAEYQKFFGNFDRSKGFKLIVYGKQSLKIYEEPREAHLSLNYFCKLELTASLTSVQKIVDNWLREFHGISLTLVTPSSELLKLIHTMIMEREDNPNCCSFYSNKCWRHYIIDVKIVTLTPLNKTYYILDWRSRKRNHYSEDCEKDQKDEKKKAIFLGPWGGPGGNYWDDGCYTGVRLIMLTYGECIDSIRVLYDKNGIPVLSEKHGGAGGHINAEVKLQFPNEYLTAVSGYFHPMHQGGHPMVRSLKFESNLRTFGPFGMQTGTPFSFSMEGGKIVGFRGRCGLFIDNIGFYIRQC